MIMKTLVEFMYYVFFIFVAMVALVLYGAFFGWFIGLIMGKPILAALAGFGISGITMWQIGALLGFVSSFFIRRGVINYKKNDKYRY